MVSIGLFMVTVGYVIYAFSWSFASIAIGFVILGFFNAFLNAGIMTFYQNNVSVDIMASVTSIYQFIQSVGQVTFVLLIGIIGDLFSLRQTIVVLAVIFSILVLQKDKRKLYWEVDNIKEDI